MTTIASLAEQLLEPIDLETRKLLARDSVRAIVDAFALPVRLTEPGGITIGCGLEGQYLHKPPRIEVARSLEPRRTKFTALHELAHHLIANNRTVAIALAGMPRAGVRAEELVASSFAARVLIPDELCREVFPAGSPTATGLVDLYDYSDGSRTACVLRAAELQRDEGYVVLARDGIVRVIEPAGNAYRIPRGGVHGSGHLLRQAEQAPCSAATVRLVEASGVESREYAGQAASSDGIYVFGVFTAATRPPWGGPGGWYDTKPIWLELDCGRCDATTWAYARCSTCGEPICAKELDSGDRCGWCHCQPGRAPKERRCAGPCGLLKHVSQFEHGGDLCVDCR